MTGFNLPPGCSVSDIPGNRPEDIAYEAFWTWVEEHLQDLSAEECRRAVLIGKAAILAERDAVEEMWREGIQEGRAQTLGTDKGGDSGR